MELHDAVSALAALSQPTRLAAFRRLIPAGAAGEPAGQIAGALGVPAPTLSFHLKELERAGLLEQRRDGRNVIYAVNFAGMRALLEFLMRDCCRGHPEICTINLTEDCHDAAACSPSRA